jgi:hypothetical protein
MFISFSNQAFFEHVMAIIYSPQKDLSIIIMQDPIKDHLTFVLRGFVIKRQIPNLTIDLSFDHNSCILSLNE